MNTPTPSIDPSPPASTPVVLYVCTTGYGDAAGTMDGLREYALARSWRIVAEYIDKNGITTEEWRPGFRAAKGVFQRRDARLLVTRYPSMAAGLETERAALVRWLAAHGAALHTTWVPSLRDPEPATRWCHYCGNEVDEGVAKLVGDVEGRQTHACAVCVVSYRVVLLADHPPGSDGRPRYRDRQPFAPQSR